MFKSYNITPLLAEKIHSLIFKERFVRSKERSPEIC